MIIAHYKANDIVYDKSGYEHLILFVGEEKYFIKTKLKMPTPPLYVETSADIDTFDRDAIASSPSWTYPIANSINNSLPTGNVSISGAGLTNPTCNCNYPIGHAKWCNLSPD